MAHPVLRYSTWENERTPHPQGVHGSNDGALNQIRTGTPLGS